MKSETAPQESRQAGGATPPGTPTDGRPGNRFTNWIRRHPLLSLVGALVLGFLLAVPALSQADKVKSLQTRLSSARSDLQTAQEELAASEDALAEATGEIDSLQADNARLRKKASAANVAGLTRSLEKSRRQLASTRQELASTRSQLADAKAELAQASNTDSSPVASDGGGGNCTSGYSPCLSPATDYDCAGGTGDGPKYAQGPIQVTGSDPYDLDSDGDGVACEA
jgi:hypothetical protein